MELADVPHCNIDPIDTLHDVKHFEGLDPRVPTYIVSVCVLAPSPNVHSVGRLPLPLAPCVSSPPRIHPIVMLVTQIPHCLHHPLTPPPPPPPSRGPGATACLCVNNRPGPHAVSNRSRAPLFSIDMHTVIFCSFFPHISCIPFPLPRGLTCQEGFLASEEPRWQQSVGE